MRALEASDRRLEEAFWQNGDGLRQTSRPKRRGPRPPHNAVFLVGFMGAGKSSVGRALGQRLNWLFEDLDDRIERARRPHGRGDFPRFGRARIPPGRARGPAASARRIARRRRKNRRPGRRGVCAERKCGAARRRLACPRFFWMLRSKNFGSAAARRPARPGRNVLCCAARNSFASFTRRGARATRRRRCRFKPASRTVEAIAAEIAETLGLKEHRAPHGTRRSRVKFETVYALGRWS